MSRVLGGGHETAISVLLTGIAIACPPTSRAQQAKSWEFTGGDEHRATTARSRQAERGPQYSRCVLDWLTESFGTLDLKKVKTLLDEMGL